MEQSRAITSEELEVRKLAKAQLEVLLRQEEISWRQKSRTTWLKEGDENTRFFHKIAYGRAKVNTHTGLLVGGVFVEDTNSIVEAISVFYFDLYGFDQDYCFDVSRLGDHKLFEHQARWVERPFEIQDIRDAVWGLGKDKTPGPDVFSIAFFQECWEVVKDDLLGVLQEFYEGGVINKSKNATFIALIPKKQGAKGL